MNMSSQPKLVLCAVALTTAALVAACSSPAPTAIETTAVPEPPVADVVPVESTPELLGADVSSIDVTPSEVVLGGVVVSLTIGAPRHLLDQAQMQLLDPAQQQQRAGETAKGAMVGPDGKSVLTTGAVVLSGMTRVTNNIDPAQPAPADTAQMMLRHAVVKVRTRDGGQPVPYLSVTMDVLLDGRPISYEQSALPMLPDDADASQIYYGNNVRFGPRGVYQVFVRVQRSPLLGRDQPQAALFNLVVR
jgi:hypothetical protein